MLEITVKTLDSLNHSFTCEEEITVRGFKEHITETVDVPADAQRLIFCGRVLQDDKKLTDYGDINGKVIHLVQRAPPQPESRSTSGDSQRQNNGSWNGDGARGGVQYRGHLHRNAMYLSAVSVPTEFVENHGLPAPQLSNTLSSTRLLSAKRMMTRANQIMDRLDDPSLPLHPSPTENNAPDTNNMSTNSEDDGEQDSRTLTNTTNRIIQAASEMFPTAAVINIRLSTANEDEDNTSNSEQLSAQTQDSAERARSGAESSEPERAGPESSESERPDPENSESERPDATNEGDGQSRRSTLNVPRPPQMADLLDRLTTTQDRLRPYIDRYRTLMSDDPTLEPGNGADSVEENQKIVDGVSECLHYLSHAFHVLSDIIVDMGQQPPRNLRCRPIIIHQSVVGIPVQVESHINLTTRNPNSNARTTNEGNEATRPSSPSSGTSDQANRSSSTPTNQNSRSTPQRSSNGQPNPQSLLGTLLDMSNLMQTPDGQSPHVTFESASPNTGDSSEADQGGIFNNNNGGRAGGGMHMAMSPPLAWIRDAIQSALSERTGVQVETSNNGSTGTANLPFVTVVGPQVEINMPNPGQSTQARSNIGTHPTTSTQTRSTARPHVLHPHSHPLNMGMGMGQNLDFDPFLPCNSHHVRRSPPATASTTTTSQATPTVPSESQNRPTGTPQPASTSARTQQGQPISFSFGGDANMARDLFDTDGQAIANGLAMTIGELFHGSMGDNVHISFVGGGPNSSEVNLTPNNDLPLADLFRTMNVNLEEFSGRNFLMDLWLFLLRNVTVGSFMQLNLGQPAPLVSLRRPLREFLEHSFPNASPATLQGQVVEQLISIDRPYLQNLLREEDTPQREGRRIDVPATIEALLRKFLEESLKLLFNNDLDDRTFAQEAITLAKKLEDQSSAVLQHVLRGGQSALEAMVQRFINQLTEGIPPFFQQTLLGVCSARIRAYATRTSSMSPQEINSLIIYKDELSATPAPSAPSPDTMDVTPSTSAVKEEEEQAQASALPLNHQMPSRSGYVRADDIVGWTEQPMDTERVVEKKLDDIPDLADGQEIPETFPGADRLPPEWIPIIARDSVRQRRQAQIDALNGPIPFSDAYLSTLPSKRRKLIEQQKPQVLVNPTTANTTAIAASVERLVREGMTHARVHEVEGAAGAVAAAPGVRNAFGHAIRDCLHPNRFTTPDFPNSKRFPNATTVFGDKDKKASASKTSK